MGNVLDYQGPNPNPPPPREPPIYADYFFGMAAIGSVALVLIALLQVGQPWNFDLHGRLGCIAGMIGWGGWIACPILGRRPDIPYWIIGVLLALATVVLYLDISASSREGIYR